MFKNNPRRDKNLPYVKKTHMIALGVGDLGFSLISCTVATYIMTFGTMAIGISGTLMGIAIAIGTIFDAVSDPLIGYWSDNSRNRTFGKRHLFMLVGIIGMMATSYFIWNVPSDISEIAKFIWFACGLTVLRSFNTLYYTPACAFSVEVSNDYNERSTIQAFRSVFYIVGMILPVVIMSNFQNKYALKDELGNIIIKGQFFAQGYQDFANVAIGICIVTSIILFATTFSDARAVRDRKKQEKPKPRPTLKQVLHDFFNVMKSKDMRSIIFGYAISMISATLIISLGFHVFTFTFELSTTQMYTIMGALLIMTVAGQPLWPKLSKKYDKKRSMIVGLSISLFGCILLFINWGLRDQINSLLLTSQWGLLPLIITMMICGLGTGVLYSMPLALIGDAVVKNSRDDKSEKTGTYAGMMTFANKVSQSITQLIAGILLDVIGFQSASAYQSYETSSKIGLILCIGVTAAIIAGIIIFSVLKLDKGEITRMMDEDEDNRIKSKNAEESTSESI
jgi:Na+/melibiose symporter-like transporter